MYVQKAYHILRVRQVNETFSNILINDVDGRVKYAVV